MRKKISFIIVVVTVYIRGRDYEVGPLPLRIVFFCAIGPEVGFTRSGLDRSGLTRRRHVITKEEFSQSYLRSNLRLHSIQHVLL